MSWLAARTDTSITPRTADGHDSRLDGVLRCALPGVKAVAGQPAAPLIMWPVTLKGKPVAADPSPDGVMAIHEPVTRTILLTMLGYPVSLPFKRG